MASSNESQGDEKISILLTNVKTEDGGIDGPRSPEFDRDDIVEPVQRKIGDYLKRMIDTTETRNVYTPADGRSFQDDLTGTSGVQGLREFENTSNSGWLEGIHINKTTKPNPNTVSRKVLYQDLNDNGSNSQISRAVSRAQEENNRFSGRNLYIPADGSGTEETSGTQDWIPQNAFGRHTPQKWPDPDGLDNIPVRISDLKKIGTQILLEASGEILSTSNTKKLGDTPAQRAGSLTPGLARLGIPVPVGRFQAGNILADINPSYSKPRVSDLENDGPEKFSYGNPYNPLVTFDGLNMAASSVAASILTLTVYGMVTALAEILKNSRSVEVNQDTDYKTRRMGSHNGEARTGLGTSGGRVSTRQPESFFMFNRTVNDYTECVKEGMKTFFDLSSGNPGFSISTVESPAYYNVLLRSLVRDTSDTFLNNRPVKPLAGSLKNPASLGQIIDNTDALISNFRDSKMFRFMDVLAQIGDIGIRSEELAEGNDSDKLVTDFIVGSDVEILGSNVNQSALHRKTRLSGVTTRGGSLTMASNTVISMYMMPEEYVRADNSISGDAGLSNKLLGDRAKYFRATTGNKLSPDDVAKMESKLDSYYVPFYFHDLRTNEIIAFHAFLENVNDSFTADYVENEGMGRIGKTYSYKNTNRNISVSFFAVSTSPEDFDDMWFKVNKLITLLYPQYTKGREITNLENGHRFIQPFSQVVGASPMIRLRVGDLIKTNFSDLDLARLFGAGSSSFVINTETIELNAERNANIQTRIEAIKSRQRMGDYSEGEVFELTENTELVPSPPVVLARRARPPRGPAATAAREARTKPRGTKLRINSKAETVNGFDYVVALAEGGTGQFAIHVEKANATRVATPVDEYIRIAAEAAYPQRQGSNTNSTPSDIQDFFSPNNNPVTQAFQSTKGEGLAGYIKSLKFDWADAPWDVRDNGKAPSMLKIDLDFAPIHDISPGLSSDGFMIGAPYNIGTIMNALKKSRFESRDAASTAVTPPPTQAVDSNPASIDPERAQRSSELQTDPNGLDFGRIGL